MGNEALIQKLDRRVEDLERKANTTIEIINDLLAEDGLPPRPPINWTGGPKGTTPGGGGVPTHIKPDTFYGRKLQTAVREYLEMRFRDANGTSPATPKEIYEAITSGGYQFDAKTPEIAMVGLRALLRKRTAFFHKLPNGTYGLTSWYPDAKKPRAQATTDEDASTDTETETAADSDDEETAAVA